MSASPYPTASSCRLPSRPATCGSSPASESHWLIPGLSRFRGLRLPVFPSLGVLVFLLCLCALVCLPPSCCPLSHRIVSLPNHPSPCHSLSPTSSALFPLFLSLLSLPSAGFYRHLSLSVPASVSLSFPQHFSLPLCLCLPHYLCLSPHAMSVPGYLSFRVSVSSPLLSLHQPPHSSGRNFLCRWPLCVPTPRGWILQTPVWTLSDALGPRCALLGLRRVLDCQNCPCSRMPPPQNSA